MKKRLGFVSNSSSSSFICQISGEEYSAWDASIEDAEMYQCEKGHTFLTQYLVGDLDDYVKSVKMDSVIAETAYELASQDNESYYGITDELRKVYYEKAKEDFTKLSEDEQEDILDRIGDSEAYYSVPKEQCPICTLEYVLDKTINDYLFSICNKSRDDITKEIQKFDNLETLYSEIEKE